jgi:hypothetical protein
MAKKPARTIENVFQSSKKYENGGPYPDLLNVAIYKTDSGECCFRSS